MNEQLFSIKEVVVKFDISQVYLRKLIRKGRIQTTKVEIGKNTFKHMIPESEMLKWKESSTNRTKRSDGRMKFTMYADASELQKIQDLLKENGIESPINRTNKVKEI